MLMAYFIELSHMGLRMRASMIHQVPRPGTIWTVKRGLREVQEELSQQPLVQGSSLVYIN